jgi:protoporphyrinogen oxidase
MNFLGSAYYEPGTVTYIVEISYRKDDLIDQMYDRDLFLRIGEGLKMIGFIEDFCDITEHRIERFDYAYVIYDMQHAKHVKVLRDYFSGEGIYLHGRFGNFEYWNADAVIRESKLLANRFARILQGGSSK